MSRFLVSKKTEHFHFPRPNGLALELLDDRHRSDVLRFATVQFAYRVTECR
jgi:hypothetical protein